MYAVILNLVLCCNQIMSGMIEGHGDDAYKYKAIKINFSSNVWHGADLRTLREHLNEQFYELTRYPEPDASSLKRLLARCYEVEGKNIVVTNGSITAFYLLAQTWKGAKSAIAVPSFAEYEDACRLHGHEVSFFPTSCDLSGLSLEGQDFCWICNPNNPTGYLYTRREMNQIRDIVKKYDLYLFSDEVYREFIYTGSPYISACHLEGIEQNVVLIDSVSKRYSECGIRIGALITKNAEVRSAVMKFCQARLSPPLIGQIAAEASLDASEEYARETYDEYVERRKCLIDGLNRIPGVYSPIPMGAFYTVAKLPVDDADKFCAWCLEEFEYEGQTVMMAPASGFYTTPGLGKNEVRMAYVLKKEDLAKALTVLSKALEAYPGRML